jgi:excinuclease ABC subunit A
METFSPYVRQFMDRMKKPDVDSINNVLPAIALQQRNSVRTSRSTVGTMTGINDYWKLIFSHLAIGKDPKTGREVHPLTPAEVVSRAEKEFGAGTDVLVTFKITCPDGLDADAMRADIQAQGYTRMMIHGKPTRLDSELPTHDCMENGQFVIVQDRVKISERTRRRFTEAVETAMSIGGKVVYLIPLGKVHTDRSLPTSEWGDPVEYRGDWYPLVEPIPDLFSSNSPIGACPQCRGYGRTLGIDYSRTITPDLSLNDGAIHIFESGRSIECKRDMMRSLKRRGDIRSNVPWKELTSHEKNWVMEGDYPGDWQRSWDEDRWYGLVGFFKYLEQRTHKMTVRVWLSRYRVYHRCPSCRGQRLRPEALCFTVGGKTLPEVQKMPMDELLVWIDEHVVPFATSDQSLKNAVIEIRSRIAYLNEVGLGYISSDRTTRTLSGGEIERVSLTTSLGASLTDTLFVLDEPTVGLHPRDTDRLIQSMQRLKDRGNTLVVVEHEEAVMRAADCLIDMGPGSGADGGNLVYAGDVSGIEEEKESITGAYLSGKKVIPVPTTRRKPKGWLRIKGASKHNLHDLDVDLPLGVYTCLTGVSGSGKSTLAHDVIYLNDCLRRGENVELIPAKVREIDGWNQVSQVVLIDQSPLIRSPRSTPAVYVGVFDDIRTLFAKSEQARRKGLTPGFFSFNSGDGRCPRCAGMGSEKVEMQFLSDVFVPCPLCHGSRYGQEALSIEIRGKNVAAILNFSVKEAIAFFASEKSTYARRIVNKLDLLNRVGLGHLVLGQPLNSLSGGENQRLKLAKILLDEDEGGSEPSLLILDEPGTGLHFADLEVLIKLFQGLVKAGHSILVIEHNMELIKAADYIIDLGPEGGIGGGKVVVSGTPEKVAASGKGYTSHFLRDTLKFNPIKTELKNNVVTDSLSKGVIALRGARHHNLKNVDLDIKRGDMTVFTGLSGSGKSSLAFDIFFAEGQRRFMDVMSPYARQFTEQMESPDIDRLTGLPPTVAIEQNMSRGGTKSTVGTVTEIWQFLRLLYSKLGQCYCPKCGIPVGKRSEGEVIELVQRMIHGAKSLSLAAPVVRGRKGHYKDLARWAKEKGYRALWIDGSWVEIDHFEALDRYSNHDIDIVIGIVDTTTSPSELALSVSKALDLGNGFLHVLDLETKKLKPVLLGTKLACPNCGTSFPELEPSTFSFNSPRGWCPTCRGHGFVSSVKMKDDETLSLAEAELLYDRDVERKLKDSTQISICPDCNGQRLHAFAREVRLQGVRPSELAELSVVEAAELIKTWKFEGREATIAHDSVSEILQRLEFLDRVGLGYLSLDRSATTLSGGETQRIRLASQLGSHLRGILYVLDEPTIGLHPKDNERLLETLDELKSRGNTLLIVEHDEATMRRADHIVDLGPGAGVHGGNIVAEGTFEELVSLPNSVTGQAFRARPQHPYRGKRRPVPRGKAEWLTISGCHVHNLRNIDVSFPISLLTVITGVSGAGKTSLLNETLYVAAQKALSKGMVPTGAQCWTKVTGLEKFRAVYQVDQSPIGKTPRSTPATYVGFMDDIRVIFAGTEDARRLGYDKGRFSFNTSAGACETCKGTGMLKLEMDFLPPSFVTCPSCHGKRFNESTLSVRYKGKTISDVMAMNFEEAADFFSSQPRISAPLSLLVDTGLGYLTLGQASNTLSGGESQRLKLVSELIKGLNVSRHAFLKGKEQPSDLYLIEEPSIGLHPHDVRRLIDVLHRLVDQGNTVIVIEHNTEIMAEADYIIDMGPGPGEEGGLIVATGTPEQIASGSSPTAKFVAEELKISKTRRKRK